MRRPPWYQCPCCGLYLEDARQHHLQVARQALDQLAAEYDSLNNAARAIAARLRQPVPTVQRRVARIRAGDPPSEPFLDLLRTLTGKLAPYQLGEVP